MYKVDKIVEQISLFRFSLLSAVMEIVEPDGIFWDECKHYDTLTHYKKMTYLFQPYSS